MSNKLLATLEKELAESLARKFLLLQKQRPGERFYAIALCLDCDLYSFYFSAQSHEAVLRELQQRSLESGTPVDQLGTDYYYPPAWEFTDETPDAADTAHGAFWDHVRAEGFNLNEAREQMFRAIINAMHRFEANGGIKQYDRNDFLLVPWIHDPGDGELTLNAVKELNPRNVFEKFDEDYFYK